MYIRDSSVSRPEPNFLPRREADFFRKQRGGPVEYLPERRVRRGGADGVDATDLAALGLRRLSRRKRPSLSGVFGVSPRKPQGNFSLWRASSARLHRESLRR